MINEKNKYLVRPSTLKGTISLSGAKNSALRILAASILTSANVIINNFPVDIIDARIHIKMIEKIGKSCCILNDKVIIKEEADSLLSELAWDGYAIRNTLLILGALVARTGSATVPLPGGCEIGERKYDLHEMLLRKMGADVWVSNGYLHAKAVNGLKGNDIDLPIRSTGATENAILCGVLAKGITRIWNPHIRPEIIDLIKFLNSMGANINVYGQEHIEINGCESLSGTTHSVIPDNMEAMTWIVASLVTGGDLEITNFPYKDLEVPLIFLRESGANFYKGENSIIVKASKCYPVEISTGPYPGINSDMQPLFAILGARATGESRIIDLRFPGRYGYVKELAKMGLKYEIQGNILKIHGCHKLTGCDVKALDLRAGAALVLAGLFAEGETLIFDSWQIERGYNHFVEKLRNVGGIIECV